MEVLVIFGGFFFLRTTPKFQCSNVVSFMIFSLRIHFFGNKYFNILATSDISRKHLILISLQTLASIKMIIKFLEPILWEINVEYIQTFNHYTQHTHTNFHLNLIFFPFRNPWKAEIRVRNGFFPNRNRWPKTTLSEEPTNTIKNFAINLTLARR